MQLDAERSVEEHKTELLQGKNTFCDGLLQ